MSSAEDCQARDGDAVEGDVLAELHATKDPAKVAEGLSYDEPKDKDIAASEFTGSSGEGDIESNEGTEVDDFQAEIDRDTATEPEIDEVPEKPFRQTWCYDATLQQAGFYVEGYGLVPDPLTLADSVHQTKPEPLPRSCSMEANERAFQPDIRYDSGLESPSDRWMG